MTASRRSGSDDGAGPDPRAVKKRSLGLRLVLATLAFGIVFTAAAVAVRTWWAWERNLEAMNAELSLIDQVFQRTLSKAIWEMDRDELQKQVGSVTQVKPVGRIELRIFKAGRPPDVVERGDGSRAGGSHLAPSLRRQLTYEPYPGATETVGELLLEGDDGVLWARLRGEVLGIVLTQLVQSLLLAALVMWVFNRTVTVHVRHIARHLGQITPATLDQPLRLQRQARHRDELGLLEWGINQLQGELSEYLERQRQDERDLAAHRDRLAELVEEKTAELRATNTRLEELSRLDPLTGLANRRHFDEVKEAEVRRAQRLGQPLSVLLCDIDYFKRYNDTYGHARGDECLRAAAQVLKQCFGRAGETPARIGGEEFAVLLPGSDAAAARAAGERLRAALAAKALPHAGSQVAEHVTMSVGVAQFDPATMEGFDALLHRADQALYRAKAEGRNCVVV